MEEGHLCDPHGLTQAVMAKYPGVGQAVARQETDHLLSCSDAARQLLHHRNLQHPLRCLRHSHRQKKSKSKNGVAVTTYRSR